MTDYLPCPFCGSKNLEDRRTVFDNDEGGLMKRYFHDPSSCILLAKPANSFIVLVGARSASRPAQWICCYMFAHIIRTPTAAARIPLAFP